MRSWQCLRRGSGVDFVTREVRLPSSPGGSGEPPEGARQEKEDAVLAMLGVKKGHRFCVPHGAAPCRWGAEGSQQEQEDAVLAMLVAKKRCFFFFNTPLRSIVLHSSLPSSV